METYNVVIPSVGGQGGLTLKRIIDTAAVLAGKHVCGATRKGLSQREGHVISFSRIGKDVYAPKVKQADADLIIGLEPNETLKSMYFCSKKTRVVFNTRKIPAYADAHASLEEIVEDIGKFTNSVKTLDATKAAREKDLGSELYANLVMLGAAHSYGLGQVFTKQEMVSAIKEHFQGKKEEIIQKNILAFEKGRAGRSEAEVLAETASRSRH